MPEWPQHRRLKLRHLQAAAKQLGAETAKKQLEALSDGFLCHYLDVCVRRNEQDQVLYLQAELCLSKSEQGTLPKRSLDAGPFEGWRAGPCPEGKGREIV